MVKNKKRILLVLLTLIVVVLNAVWACGFKSAKAETDNDEEISPQLLTTLSLGISSENGMVYGRVYNDFTLGFSTVRVVVELYSSYTYQESYTKMNLECRNSTPDLDIFKKIETSAPTNGETKYWMARGLYKINSGNYQEKVTSIWHIDGDGNVI